MIPLRDSVPSRTWPVVTYALIAANVLMFFYELSLGPQLNDFIERWGFTPARYFALAETDPSNWLARILPILTSMFLHGGFLHLIGNMAYLWIFGDNVEDRLGHLRYFAAYIMMGLGAGLTHAYLNPDSTIAAIGASGAISGVLGGFIVLFPHARIFTLIPLVFIFFTVVELPAIVYLGIWFLMQLLSGTFALAMTGEGSGVAWWAHVGGFVIGMVLVPLLQRRTERPRWRPQYAPW